MTGASRLLAGRSGPLGDPQQFADALRQFADLMSYQGGPVNWDLAKNVARQTVAAKGDPSVLDVERAAGRRRAAAGRSVAGGRHQLPYRDPHRCRRGAGRSGSRRRMPVWSKLCDPIAERAVDAMGGMLTEDPGELGGMPPELQSAMSAMQRRSRRPGRRSAQMMRRIGGMMVGGQTGAAVGALAQEVVSSTDVGLPLGPEGVAALLPAGVAEFGAGPVDQPGRGPALPGAARGRASPAVRARALAARPAARRGRGLRARDHGRRVRAAGRHAAD